MGASALITHFSSNCKTDRILISRYHYLQLNKVCHFPFTEICHSLHGYNQILEKNQFGFLPNLQCVIFDHGETMAD